MKNDYISNYLSDRSAERVAANPEWCWVNEGCTTELRGVEVQILHSPSTLPPVLTWCIAVWDQGTQQGDEEKLIWLCDLLCYVHTKRSSTWRCRKLKAAGRKMQCSTLIHFQVCCGHMAPL